MNTLSSVYLSAVCDDLVLRAGMAQIFDRCAAARGFWETHLIRRGYDPMPGGPPPECLIRFDERPGSPLGLVVSGRWDTHLEGFDLTHPFLVVSSVGDIQRCESCLVEIVTVL